jgi:hypothetical protein
MDTILMWITLIIVYIGLPYFLAKRKGKDPLKFIVLGLLFSIFVWGYLIFCKSDYQEGGELGFYKSVKSINGVSETMAQSIIKKYPNRRRLRKAKISDLQNIPGVGEKLAVSIKENF